MINTGVALVAMIAVGLVMYVAGKRSGESAGYKVGYRHGSFDMAGAVSKAGLRLASPPEHEQPARPPWNRGDEL